MPFALQQLHDAHKAYRQFLDNGPRPHHARYVFPFFSGSYFAYRKVDAARVSAIATSLSPSPSYVDVGCGYGDFLKRIREFIPQAIGIEKEGGIFYAFKMEKPDYISLVPTEAVSQQFDVAFVGWMEPGQDFRRAVSSFARCVITTFDAGGQCGINGGCEYEEFGYQRVAWWRTPSWIDVNAEIMNRYYTPGIDSVKKDQLAGLRSAHNFWYVYARPEDVSQVSSALRAAISSEASLRGYDFEMVLDECGFGYMQTLPGLATGSTLWQVTFD